MSRRPRGLAELDDFDAVFAALAHRSRRTILSVLHVRGGQMTSGDIAGRFDHSWPTISQHLRVLEQAGLVTIELRGREHIYRLQTAWLHAVAGGWLARFTDGPAWAPDGQAQATDGPAQATDSPAQAPQGPVQAPQSPVHTPQSPVHTPQGPVHTPQGPDQAPEGPDQATGRVGYQA